MNETPRDETPTWSGVLPDLLDVIRNGGAARLAEQELKRMAQMAPREPGAPDLADNIVISTGRVIKPKGSDSHAAAVNIGPEKRFFYGFFQEFGTVHHGAQPFVRPAFDGGVTKALSDMARALWTALAARGISRTVTSDAPIESDGPLT